MIQPSKLHGTFGFGSTWKQAIGRVHYDCGCEFQYDGTLRLGTNSNDHWPAPVAVASYFQSWGALCMNFVFSASADESLFDKVLTPSAIHSESQTNGPILGFDVVGSCGSSFSTTKVVMCYTRK